MSENVLVVGAWRNGLDGETADRVADVEKRRVQGFRQLLFEKTVADLVDLLDSQDEFVADQLTHECKCGKKAQDNE